MLIKQSKESPPFVAASYGNDLPTQQKVVTSASTNMQFALKLPEMQAVIRPRAVLL